MLIPILLFSTSLLNAKPSPVFADVRIGSSGPYRFLIDTGSQSSLIDSKLAETLNLRPEYRVEVITQNSSRLLPALKTGRLRIGQKDLPNTELIFDDLAEAKRLDSSIQGVLGLNAFTGLDFALLPRAGRLDLTSGRPAGEAVPLYRVDERMAIKARMGRETLTLILDSGATHAVLFHTPAAMKKTRAIAANMTTIEGARNTVPTIWSADMFLDNGLKVGMLPAAIVRRPPAQADGLIPTSAFSEVYIDTVRQEAVLVH
jgi:predicted aspartyl protease